MSVIVTIWVQGNPSQLEEYAAANREAMQAILEDAKQHGVIAHRFYGNEGQIMVIDEWPDAESFHAFFEKNQEGIGSLMQSAGVQGPPGVNIWRKLETHDEVGWGS